MKLTLFFLKLRVFVSKKIKLIFFKRNFSAIWYYLCCLGSWKGKSLTSRWSIATFDRTDGHIGNEISQVVVNCLQSRILVNARKSELANWNCEWVIPIKYGKIMILPYFRVLSKTSARRLGKTRNANVSHLYQA